MAGKNYSEEFRRQAVDLYESTSGATLRGIAADLGIERATLARWVEVYGSGEKTTGDGTIVSSPSRTRRRKTPTGAAPESPEAKLARLEAENAQLGRTRPSSRPSGRSCARRPSISPGRRTGEPLPVRRRPLHHLPPLAGA